jgi:hypothetical protein
VKSSSGEPFGQLRFARQHQINIENVRYHRNFWTKKSLVPVAKTPT